MSQKIKVILSTIKPLDSRYVELGLYNIVAYAEKNIDKKLDVKIRVKTIDSKHKIHLTKNDFCPRFSLIELQKIAADLLKESPQVIGFSCFVWNTQLLLRLTKMIKKQNPLIKIILGGPEVSYKPHEILSKNKDVDVIVMNDGEQALSELIEYFFLRKLKPENILGITYRKDNKIVTNPLKAIDLDLISSPYLAKILPVHKKDFLLIETLRGCPFRCAYCSFHLGNYSRVRYFSLKKVIQELDFLYKKNIRYLGITDDNFNINEERAIKILQAMSRHHKKVEIMLFLNVCIRKLSYKFVSLLAENKIVPSIGIQTINTQTLNTIFRPTNLSLVKKNLIILNKGKVNYEIQFIIGLPGDTFDDFIKNIEWGLDFHPYKLLFMLLWVTYGTSLYENASSYGLIHKKFPPYTLIKTPTFNKKEISSAERIVNSLNLLYNDGLLKNTIVYLKEVYGIPYGEILKQWDFYYKKLFKINKKITLSKLAISFVNKLLKRRKIVLKNELKFYQLITNDLENYSKRKIKK